MIPDMADVLLEWELPYTIKTVTKTKNNELVVTKNIIDINNVLLVVQTESKAKLNPATVDWSLDYLCIHSRVKLELNNFLVYDNRLYEIKAADNADSGLYGVYEYLGQEYKKAI